MGWKTTLNGLAEIFGLAATVTTALGGPVPGGVAKTLQLACLLISYSLPLEDVNNLDAKAAASATVGAIGSELGEILTLLKLGVF